MELTRASPNVSNEKKQKFDDSCCQRASPHMKQQKGRIQRVLTLHVLSWWQQDYDASRTLCQANAWPEFQNLHYLKSAEIATWCYIQIHAAHYSSKSPSPLQTDRYVGFADLLIQASGQRKQMKRIIEELRKFLSSRFGQGKKGSLISLGPSPSACVSSSRSMNARCLSKQALWCPESSLQSKNASLGFNWSIDCSTCFATSTKGQTRLAVQSAASAHEKTKTNLRSLVGY